MVMLCLSFTAAGAADFTLTSPDIKKGELMSMDQVYKGFGCQGSNISPALKWANAPDETKSFAITVFDPDAPTGIGWHHWVVFNIPASVTELAANAGSADSKNLPEGSIQSVSDYGAPGYGGPCPPADHDPHRYIFTVYALDIPKIDLPATAMPALVRFMINNHTLAKAELTGYYSRTPKPVPSCEGTEMDKDLMKHGAFSWRELMTTDVEGAKKFYTELFGWKLRDEPMEEGVYIIASVDDKDVAGIMGMPPEAQGAPSNWGVYITVTDIEATLKKAAELGGKIILPPKAIPDVGQFAVLQDPQGAYFSIFMYQMK